MVSDPISVSILSNVYVADCELVSVTWVGKRISFSGRTSFNNVCTILHDLIAPEHVLGRNFRNRRTREVLWNRFAELYLKVLKVAVHDLGPELATTRSSEYVADRNEDLVDGVRIHLRLRLGAIHFASLDKVRRPILEAINVLLVHHAREIVDFIFNEVRLVFPLSGDWVRLVDHAHRILRRRLVGLDRLHRVKSVASDIMGLARFDDLIDVGQIPVGMRAVGKLRRIRGPQPLGVVLTHRQGMG